MIGVTDRNSTCLLTTTTNQSYCEFMSTQKVTITAIFLLIVFPSILVSVHAIETIELSGGRQAARAMILISGDSVTGTLTCVDNEANITNPVDFWIEDDDGNAIASYDDTLGTSFSFVAAKNGTYTLCFRNNANVYTSTEARFTLDYSRNKPEDSIFSGNTPYIIMTAAAVTLAVIFAFVAFRRRKQPLPPPPT